MGLTGRNRAGIGGVGSAFEPGDRDEIGAQRDDHVDAGGAPLGEARLDGAEDRASASAESSRRRRRPRRRCVGRRRSCGVDRERCAPLPTRLLPPPGRARIVVPSSWSSAKPLTMRKLNPGFGAATRADRGGRTARRSRPGPAPPHRPRRRHRRLARRGRRHVDRAGEDRCPPADRFVGAVAQRDRCDRRARRVDLVSVGGEHRGGALAASTRAASGSAPRPRTSSVSVAVSSTSTVSIDAEQQRGSTASRSAALPEAAATSPSSGAARRRSQT